MTKLNVDFIKYDLKLTQKDILKQQLRIQRTDIDRSLYLSEYNTQSFLARLLVSKREFKAKHEEYKDTRKRQMDRLSELRKKEERYLKALSD